MPHVRFGWVVPVIGIAETEYVPLAMVQQRAILPAVARRFDSVWVYDHFYGFDNRDGAHRPFYRGSHASAADHIIRCRLTPDPLKKGRK